MEFDRGGGGGGLRFDGIRAFFVEQGMQARRLKVWSQKLQLLGAKMEDHLSREATHVFAANIEKLKENIGIRRAKRLQSMPLRYEWIEDCLKAGILLPTEQYLLALEPARRSSSSSDESHSGKVNFNGKEEGFSPRTKRRTKSLAELGSQLHSTTSMYGETGDKFNAKEAKITAIGPGQAKKENKQHLDFLAVEGRGSSEVIRSGGITVGNVENKESKAKDQSVMCSVSNEKDSSASCYTPPDLNRNITEPFAELKDIYKDALGDDRRSFSYQKSLTVLEKLPFKITSVDQVKGLPTIGKSMQDHIHEILTTGQSSKLENFKKDERVCTIRLFGSVWGIGPATAQKLYEKGHRTLEDLKNEHSLTAVQRIGLQFYNDINQKIPRHEVKDMEALVKEAAYEIQPGMDVVCGGSYRRGKTLCGDMDIVITHPDGQSHKGFLQKFVSLLKARNFLTEDLRFSPANSLEGTDAGVDTYYGLCKYPGREQRHRIDLKVYPFDIYPFGLIAWTGNDVLNRRLRLVAESKGYRLDDTGLFPVMLDAHSHKVAKRSSIISCKSEKEVFEVLGFPWLEPHERNL